MPGLPFTQLPGMRQQDQTPEMVLDTELKGIQDFYTGQESRLKRQMLTDTQYAGAIYDLQARYDVAKQRVTSKRQQLKTINRLMTQGHITPEAGQQAMWRMVLPQETEQAMFPRPAKAKPAPFSPQQLESFNESIEEFTSAAKEVPGWEWGPPKRKTKDLVKQYMGWRDYIGYENLAPIHKRQVDIQWDDWVAGQDWLMYDPDKKTGWHPKSPEVRAARGIGRLQRTVAKRMTPLARSVTKTKPTAGSAKVGKGSFVDKIKISIGETLPKQRVLDATTAKAILQEAGGDKERARMIAKQRGYKF